MIEVKLFGIIRLETGLGSFTSAARTLEELKEAFRVSPEKKQMIWSF